MRPPRRRLAPRDWDHQAAHLQPLRSGAGGPGRDCRGAPPSPPPFSPLSPPHGPRTAGGGPGGRRPQPPPRRALGGTPPPEGRDTQGGTLSVRRVPPVSRPPTPAVPAAGQQPCAGAQGRPVGRNGTAAPGHEPMRSGGWGTDETTCFGAHPGRAETQIAARRPSRPAPRGASQLSRRGGTAHRPPPPPSG